MLFLHIFCLLFLHHFFLSGSIHFGGWPGGGCHERGVIGRVVISGGGAGLWGNYVPCGYTPSKVHTAGRGCLFRRYPHDPATSAALHTPPAGLYTVTLPSRPPTPHPAHCGANPALMPQSRSHASWLPGAADGSVCMGLLSTCYGLPSPDPCGCVDGDGALHSMFVSCRSSFVGFWMGGKLYFI